MHKMQNAPSIPGGREREPADEFTFITANIDRMIYDNQDLQYRILKTVPMLRQIKKEVPVKQVFEENVPYLDLFYTGQFDFVVYQRNYAKQEIPILAIELDGKEHQEDWVVRRRDEKKQQICRAHNFELIRIDNTYARRYQHIKDILIDYLKKVNGR